MNPQLLKVKSLISTLLLLSLFQTYTKGQDNAIIETILQKGHKLYVSCVDCSPNNKFIATGSYDHNIILWNTNNGKQIRTLSMHTAPVKSLFFSPDGNKIISTNTDDKAIVYDIITGKVLMTLGEDNFPVKEARFSPDGSKIIISSNNNNILICDTLSGNIIKTYRIESTASLGSQFTNSTGDKFVSYKNNNSMQLVNLTDSLFSPTFSIDEPYSYAISPTSNHLAISTNKSITIILDLKTGKKLHELTFPQEKRYTYKPLISFSHSGKYLATASKYSDIIIWDVKKGTQLISIKKPKFLLDQIIFSPDEKHISISCNDKSYVWDIKTGRQELYLSNDGLRCLPVFSKDSKSLLANNKNNTAALWDLSSGKKHQVFKGYQNSNNDILDFDQSDFYHFNIRKHLAKKNKATLSPDGKYIAKNSVDSVVILLNIETGKIERILKGHSKSVNSCTFSHDGKYLLTGSSDATIKLRDIQSGKIIRTIIGHQALIFDAKFSSDDKYIVSGSWDGSLRIWETNTGKQLKYIRTPDASPYCVNFTPNDLYVLSGDLNHELKLWEIDAGEEFRNIIGHTDIVSDACFSSDGKQMITASHDGTVKVWDLLSGMLLNKLTHRSGVYSLAYHPKGKYIASGCNDRTIQLWDVTSGKKLQTLYGHSGGVTSLQFSADGSRLVSCSIDGEIKVWDMNSFKELFTYIQIDRENWLAKNPQGYFDGSPSALKQINYVSGLDVINIGSLFEKYYSPNLIKSIQEGKNFEANNQNIKRLIQNIPQIKVKLPSNTTNVDTISADSIIAYQHSIKLNVSAKDEKSGIDEIRIYNNGKLVHQKKYTNTNSRGGKKHLETFDISITKGENNINAIAFNKDRTESEPSALKIYYDGKQSDVNLYILTVGINKYKNPTYSLNYAINDAKSYSSSIQKHSISIFNSVEEHFIKNDDANKEGILEAFNLIAQKAGPEDVFIFYFAGHGAMSTQDASSATEFHIIPYDVTKLYGDNQMLKEKAISANEILELSMQIPARKQLFVLDACQSGGALASFNNRGATREKAIAQLARSTGTFFLLASGAIQYATEAHDLKHGIFTYALLEGLKGKADGGTHDKKITANELKSYVEDRVPQLTQEYMLTPQYPTGYSFGQDFPIVLAQ